jgi:carboxymethylenebutenolidase
MSYSTITGSIAAAIHTPAEGLRAGVVEIPAKDTALQAYYAVREGVAHPPIILVVQEIFGVHEHIKDICRRFAHEGYLAVAVELYQRQGDPSAYSEMNRLIEDIVARVPDEQVLTDLDAAARWAVAQGGDGARLGITGFCWGGRIVWLYCAHNPACKAGVAWYGRLTRGHGPLQVRNPLDVARDLLAPVLGLYGGEDTGIPLDDVWRMEAALEEGGAASKASHMKVYDRSGHAFFADYRPSYNAEDAADAWQKTLDWFERHL